MVTADAVIHGDRDEEVPIEMARNLASALASAGTECVLVEVSAGHFGVVAAEAAWWPRRRRAVRSRRSWRATCSPERSRGLAVDPHDGQRAGAPLSA